MIRLELDEKTLRGVRIATSPLWEAISSLALLARYSSEVPFPYRGWANQTLQALEPADLRYLLKMLTPASPVLTPIPPSPRPDFAAELDAFRDQFTEKNGNPDTVQFAERLEHYWHVAIEPFWTAMRNVLEEEILLRGRKLATDGASAMLSELGRVSWNPPVLTAPHQLDIETKIEDSQLYIVPVLFARGMRIFIDNGDGQAAISYQARGASVFDERANEKPARNNLPPRADRLAELLGRGRASVLRALVVPTTTTVVARAVGLAPSTVSQHLSALHLAGVVRKRRSGSRVLYELDHGGFILLNQVDGAGE